jgi:SAM-dependent methyltransferase
MLAVARAVAPGIDWRQGNADAVPLRDGEQFDVVVCQQGMQFFPDKAAAGTQMRLALTKGGRLAVTTWRPDEEIPFFRELRQMAERRLGAIVDQRHSFGDAASLEVLLQGTGFDQVRSRTISRTIRFDPDTPFLRLNTMALVGMSAAAKTMSDEERKQVVETIVNEVNESAPVLQRFMGASVIAFDLSTNLTTAVG